MTDTDPNAPPRPKVQPTYFERERGVTQIAVENAVALFTVRADSALVVLERLAEARVPINHVKLSTDGLSFVVSENHATACQAALKQANFIYTVQAELAIVRTVAGAMRDLSGVVARIYEALIGVDVSVRLVGDAYDSVFGLVAQADANKAESALRAQFEIGDDQ